MDQIGRYRIRGELGRGAMGIVYKAEDPAIGRTVAIKTIRLGEVSDLKERNFLRDRLFREARSAGILSHPNIVTIYDIQEHDDMAYVFMEFVDGPSLEKVMSRGPIDRKVFLGILDQTAAALDYAHSKGIIHRDIKPANIMLASDGAAKITDFGVAKLQSAQATQTGIVMGTPSYMSPEQIADRPLDGRSDLFSLAVIAYQLLTGEKPFSGPTLPSLMYKIVHEHPLPPQRLNPSLGAAVEIVLQRAMHKEAVERYPNCAQFVKALTAACDSKPGWQLMGQGGVESLETVAGSAPTPQAPPRPIAPLPAIVAVVPPPAADGDGSSGIPVTRGGWLGPGIAILIGLIVLAGIVWLGSRLLFNNDAPQQEAAKVERREDVPPASRPAPSEASKPSPVGPSKPEPPPAPVATPAVVAPAKPRDSGLGLKEVEVRFETEPAGANISVGGISCASPCEPVLAVGRHTVTATMEGYRLVTRSINVPDDLVVRLTLERTIGTVAVTSTPPGGAIFVNGQQRPEKTPASIRLPVGKYKIQVQAAGFPKDEQDVEVREGSLLRVDFKWGN
ncbi:MAG: serine/threonine-protein kinase [Bryobacteraceae bacterium]|nr:serine/threonine-protein kinase [Bryobacteraceae bacterium]